MSELEQGQPRRRRRTTSETVQESNKALEEPKKDYKRTVAPPSYDISKNIKTKIEENKEEKKALRTIKKKKAENNHHCSCYL